MAGLCDANQAIGYEMQDGGGDEGEVWGECEWDK